MGEGSNTLSNSAIVTLRKVTRKVLGSQEPQGDYGGAAHHRSVTWYWGQISSGSSLAAGSLASPSTFLFDIWFPDPSDTSAHPAFIVSTDSNDLGVTGVNRSTMTGAAGTMIKVEYAYGEWSPKWGDC